MHSFSWRTYWLMGWSLFLLNSTQGWARPHSTSHDLQSPPLLVAQSSAPVLAESARIVTGSMDSTRVKLLEALARGDISAAIVAYETDTGKEAPEWLTALQSAYSATNQVAGNCQNVARTLYTAYQRLGQDPKYIAFRSRVGADYITFDLLNGKNASVSRTGYHVAVEIGDMVHDAYTGPLGMKLSEYLSRLQAVKVIDWQIVSTP